MIQFLSKDIVKVLNDYTAFYIVVKNRFYNLIDEDIFYEIERDISSIEALEQCKKRGIEYLMKTDDESMDSIIEILFYAQKHQIFDDHAITDEKREAKMTICRKIRKPQPNNIIEFKPK
ncbi:hypothetical protein [Xylocopilactobacillus apis]|uniref:Uncharacterized protein n=1 Tax=Xylocopilactobacillus apis TaxID=2932183 RepID=A0AAU9D4L3_9LACO|nr:hypothetical protein [Xylocopilactobacillus apis]BDR57416.1 hypothetical protein KIMC2_19780 [Xylocopilactobacillus apis]